MKLLFYIHIFEKIPQYQNSRDPNSGSRFVPCGWTDGQTDMTKLTLAFRNFANTTTNCRHLIPLKETQCPTFK